MSLIIAEQRETQKGLSLPDRLDRAPSLSAMQTHNASNRLTDDLSDLFTENDLEDEDKEERDVQEIKEANLFVDDTDLTESLVVMIGMEIRAEPINPMANRYLANGPTNGPRALAAPAAVWMD